MDEFINSGEPADIEYWIGEHKQYIYRTAANKLSIFAHPSRWPQEPPRITDKFIRETVGLPTLDPCSQLFAFNVNKILWGYKVDLSGCGLQELVKYHAVLDYIGSDFLDEISMMIVKLFHSIRSIFVKMQTVNRDIILSIDDKYKYYANANLDNTLDFMVGMSGPIFCMEMLLHVPGNIPAIARYISSRNIRCEYSVYMLLDVNGVELEELDVKKYPLIMFKYWAHKCKDIMEEKLNEWNIQ